MAIEVRVAWLQSTHLPCLITNMVLCIVPDSRPTPHLIFSPSPPLPYPSHVMCLPLDTPLSLTHLAASVWRVYPVWGPSCLVTRSCSSHSASCTFTSSLSGASRNCHG